MSVSLAWTVVMHEIHQRSVPLMQLSHSPPHLQTDFPLATNLPHASAPAGAATLRVSWLVQELMQCSAYEVSRWVDALPPFQVMSSSRESASANPCGAGTGGVSVRPKSTQSFSSETTLKRPKLFPVAFQWIRLGDGWVYTCRFGLTSTGTAFERMPAPGESLRRWGWRILQSPGEGHQPGSSPSANAG